MYKTLRITLFLIFFNAISLISYGQVRLTNNIGYTFITRGDLPGFQLGTGIEIHMPNNWTSLVSISSTQAIITTPYNTGFITQSPTSIITYPYNVGIDDNGSTYSYLNNQGIYALGSSPVNSQLNCLQLGVLYSHMVNDRWSIHLKLAASLGHFKESFRNLEVPIYDGTNPLIQIPQEFILVQTIHSQYLDLGYELGLGTRKKVSENTEIGLGFYSLSFPDSGSLNWNTTISVSTML